MNVSKAQNYCKYWDLHDSQTQLTEQMEELNQIKVYGNISEAEIHET